MNYLRESWQTCDNCKHDCKEFYPNCTFWAKMPCSRCGGALSETREHNGRKYRHCYSCHKEFFEDGES